MASELHLIKGQATLRAPIANNTRTRLRTTVVFRMVRDVELRPGVLLEPLQAIPGNVLQSDQTAVGGKQEIKVSHADDGVVDRLDHVSQNTILRRTQRGISQSLIIGSEAKHVRAGALLPIGWWSIDRFLNIAAVEVDDFSRRNIIAWVDAAEDVPRVGAGFSNMVDVEAGVD